jgi:hypothetical protein
MKYIFSAQFLKVKPPATSFGDAWELLCIDLLRAEHPNLEFQHLRPPDRGVDILSTSTRKAFQCKADERGAHGTAPMQSSIDSLITASKHSDSLGWNKYFFATNADYSGKFLEKIHNTTEELGIDKSLIGFHGPQYWSDLCDKHLKHVQDRLDYRLLFSEEQVLEAFRKARYFEEKVIEYKKLIQEGNYNLELKNNRTPITLSLPFSRNMTIEHCIDVAMQLLNISIDSCAYSDLGTSVRPSISIVLDRVPQKFKTKIGELRDADLDRLELWIKVIWKDELEESTKPARSHEMQYLEIGRMQSKTVNSLSQKQRGQQTLERYKQDIQLSMWSASSQAMNAKQPFRD